MSAGRLVGSSYGRMACVKERYLDAGEDLRKYETRSTFFLFDI